MGCNAVRVGVTAGPYGGISRQNSPNTDGKWIVGSEGIIGRLRMEVTKTITVKFTRPDGTIIVVTLTIKVK